MPVDWVATGILAGISITNNVARVLYQRYEINKEKYLRAVTQIPWKELKSELSTFAEQANVLKSAERYQKLIIFVDAFLQYQSIRRIFVHLCDIFKSIPSDFSRGGFWHASETAQYWNEQNSPFEKIQRLLYHDFELADHLRSSQEDIITNCLLDAGKVLEPLGDRDNWYAFFEAHNLDSYYSPPSDALLKAIDILGREYDVYKHSRIFALKRFNQKMSVRDTLEREGPRTFCSANLQQNIHLSHRYKDIPRYAVDHIQEKLESISTEIEIYVKKIIPLPEDSGRVAAFIGAAMLMADIIYLCQKFAEELHEIRESLCEDLNASERKIFNIIETRILIIYLSQANTHLEDRESFNSILKSPPDGTKWTEKDRRKKTIVMGEQGVLLLPMRIVGDSLKAQFSQGLSDKLMVLHTKNIEAIRQQLDNFQTIT